MRIIAHDLDEFQHVYGADSFLHYFPEITTMGVPIILVNGNYYIHKDGKPVDKVHSFQASTCFFAPEELEYVTLVED